MSYNSTAAAPGTGTTAAIQSFFKTTTAVYPQSITLSITPLQREAARSFALARERFHDGHRKPDQDLGPQGNRRADAYGVLGELVVVQALEANGFLPAGYSFFRAHIPPPPDFVLNGLLRFDVKSVPPGTRYLAINERCRLASHHLIDAYLPVVFSSAQTATIYAPIPTAEVEQWPLRRVHSAYRSCRIDDLRPLLSWSELLTGGLK